MFVFFLLLAVFVSAEAEFVEELPEPPRHLFDDIEDLEPAVCGDGICEANPYECIDDCLEAAGRAEEAGATVTGKSVLPIAIPIVVVTCLLVVFIIFIKKKEIKLLKPRRKFRVKMKRRKYKPKSRR